MTPDELEFTFQSFAALRPFRTFVIELMSGDRVTVVHPEAVRRAGTSNLFVHRAPDRCHRVFNASAVCQVIEQGAQEPRP